MIPTTLTGILLLLILLLPGFVFVTLRERHQPTRKLSVFRETSVVLAATTASYLPPAVLVAVLLSLVPPFRAEVVLALGDLATYTTDHPLRFLTATALLVVIGVAIGALLGTKRFVPLLVGTPGGSAWWKLFDPDPKLVGKEFTTEVTATLDDGTVITGILHSWNRDAEDGPDREFTLQAPLWIQTPTETDTQELDAAAVTISARVLRYATVRYIVSDETFGTAT